MRANADVSRLLAAGLLMTSTVAAAQPPAQESKFAAVNGVKLHYVEVGSGNLILFLHGFPEFWYEWRKQLADFGRDHHAVAPDQRGYNLSEKPESVEAYRVSQLIEDVRALAQQLNGGKRFTLVAHDWGGAIAWAFAIKHPGLLDKLVIINAPHPGVFARLLREDSAQQAASQYMLFFRSPRAESILSANNNAPLMQIFSKLKAAGQFSTEDEQAYLAAWNQPGALTGGLNYYRASRVGPPSTNPGGMSSEREPFIEGDLTVQVPTLVIWGEKDDALLTSNLDGLERYVPSLTIKRIPDGSHWVIHEQPDRVNQLIREFLATR